MDVFVSCPGCGTPLRNAPRIFCSCGETVINEEPGVLFKCPDGRPVSVIPGADWRLACAQKNGQRAHEGALHWQKLHTYTQQGDWSEVQAIMFLDEWLHTIPERGCKCKEHFSEILEANPYDASSEESLFQWGVHVHNLVNKKLGKAVITLEFARELHRAA